MAVISRKVARLFFPGTDPVGQAIRTDLGPGVPRTRVVAGVVGDVRQEGLALEDAPAVRPRFVAGLTTLFAALALFLGAVGVYGVLAAYSVSQRLHEIGVRLSLVASRWSVQALLVRQAMAPALLGLILGLGAAVALSRTLARLLYGVEPTDPAVYALVSCLLLAVVLLASHLPARQATRIDLTRSLRCE